MTIKYANDAKSTLASGLTSSATSLSVANAGSFPTISSGDEMYLTLADALNSVSEIVKCTAVSGTTFTVVRGYESTTAVSWAAGSNVQLRITAGLITNLLADAGGDFVAITENSTTGYGTSYRAAAPANYGDIGSSAVDLSVSSFTSTTLGATGNYSLAVGLLTTASGHYSVAAGYQADATGQYAVATGYQTDATGDYSTAGGSQTLASGIYSTAMGSGTTASLNYAVASGLNTTASGFGSTAMGHTTVASGAMSVGTGYNSVASGNYSLASGQETSAVGDKSAAFGLDTTASGPSSLVLGERGGIGTTSGTLFGVAYSASSPADLSTTTTDTNLVFKVSNTGAGYFAGNVEVTGNVAVTGTVDGVDIASRDSVLTTTTDTVNNLSTVYDPIGASVAMAIALGG